MGKRSKRAKRKPAQPWKTPIPRVTVAEPAVVSLTIGDRGVPVRVNDSGLPKISGRLMELARPALRTLPKDADEADVVGVVEVATAAWNTPMLDRPDSIASEALRERTRTVIENVQRMAPEVRELFDAMVEERRTTFADDPRIIAGTTVTVRDGMIHLDAASLHIR